MRPSEPDHYVTFEVPGEPVPKKRPRVVRGRTFTPPETVAYETAIGWAFRQAYAGEPFEGRLRVHVTAREASRRLGWQGDADNYAKSALDALNGLAWKDDRQIEDLYVHVNRQAVVPGMFIEIEEMGVRDAD